MIKRVNILYLIATLDVGGAERQLVELVRRIDRKRFRLVVCCLTRGGPLEEELKKTGIKYYVIGKQFKFANRINAKIVLVIGPDEQKNNMVNIKNMETGEQIIVPRDEIIATIKKLLVAK